MQALTILKYGKLSDSLKKQDVPAPSINDDQLIIETHSASFNPIDFKIVRGDFKAINKIKFPGGIGRDVSGVVHKVGRNVKNFNVGDRVYSRVAENLVGTMAELVVSNEADVALMPKNLTFDEAASIPLAGLTAYQALVNVAKLTQGENILIHAGSGGVGTIAIQLSKHLGANVTTTTSTNNIALVRGLGADKIIDYKNDDYLDRQMKYDVIFDTLGSNHTLNSFQVLRHGGRVVSIAGDIDDTTAKQLGLNGLVRFLLRLKVGKILKAASKIDAQYRFLFMSPSGSELEKLAHLYETDTLRPVIDKTYPFDQSTQAIEYLSTGRAKGKVIVKVKPD